MKLKVFKRKKKIYNQNSSETLWTHKQNYYILSIWNFPFFWNEGKRTFCEGDLSDVVVKLIKIEQLGRWWDTKLIKFGKKIIWKFPDAKFEVIEAFLSPLCHLSALHSCKKTNFPHSRDLTLTKPCKFHWHVTSVQKLKKIKSRNFSNRPKPSRL